MQIVARKVLTGQEEEHSYDALVLAPGAAPIKPRMPGTDLPGIFPMKTIPDRWAAGLVIIIKALTMCCAASSAHPHPPTLQPPFCHACSAACNYNKKQKIK